MRTLLVLAALALAGLGLARLTRPAPVAAVPPPPAEESAPPVSDASFELLLSAPAKSVALDAGGPSFIREHPGASLTGRIAISGAAPLISLKVVWADASPGHRFAKLRLDRPGRDTLEHVFSAAGDLDDIWEP
jgi:hypothetical protein